jgi:ubiquinone/menaquinone biosynthesis C-methylase UbiE
LVIENGKCGVMKTDYTSLADQYATHRRVHPEVLSRLSGTCGKDARVLEVGCGTGNYIGAISRAVGCECIGLDPAPEMLAKVIKRSPSVVIIEGSAERLNLPERSVDFVFSVDVIHHVDNRALAFREAFRVLRPRGRICTVTESEWMLRHRGPLTMYFPETIESELARYPSVDSLHSDMKLAGFSSLVDEAVEHQHQLVTADAFRAKAYSALLSLTNESFGEGLARLETALAAGPLPCVSRYLLVWGFKPDDV